MNPLWSVLLTQPQLVAGHAIAYANLASQETLAFVTLMERRLVLTIAAMCCATLSLGLTGVAVMLWLMAPQAFEAARWPMGLVPLAPATGLVWCLMRLGNANSRPSFLKLRQQWSADGELFKEATL